MLSIVQEQPQVQYALEFQNHRFTSKILIKIGKMEFRDHRDLFIQNLNEKNKNNNTQAARKLEKKHLVEFEAITEI